MLLSHKQLMGLLVETQSRQKLGYIDGFNLEVDSQTIYQYQVKPSGLSKIFSQELLIQRQQVISISADKMVVDDLVYKKLAADNATLSKNPLPTEAITTSEN